jgi:hypothetical protein
MHVVLGLRLGGRIPRGGAASLARTRIAGVGPAAPVLLAIARGGLLAAQVIVWVPARLVRGVRLWVPGLGIRLRPSHIGRLYSWFLRAIPVKGLR